MEHRYQCPLDKPLLRDSGCSIAAMSSFREKFPELITPHKNDSQDRLGESILDHQQPWLRLFEPTEIAVVIGRNQDPRREVLVDVVQAAGIPIYRRVTGGGTVILSPGTLVIALRLKQHQVGVECYFADINNALIRGLKDCAVDDAACFGHGDLAIQENGKRLKILGASLRQSRGAVYYLGVLMIDDLVPLMQRYLPMPSKQPDYRTDRSHADFCTHLGQRGLRLTEVQAALEASLRRDLGPKALLD